jgi:hypothetical protein
MTADNTRGIRAIADLPRDIAPARDLWPGIAAQIGATNGQRPRAWRVPTPAWAFAAAVACVAVGVWIGRASSPPRAMLAANEAPAASATRVQAVGYAPGARFERTREALLREVGERLAGLPPATRARVEASLATVQRARDEIGAALGRDPGNALLQEMLVNSYQDEMRVLTTVREIGT